MDASETLPGALDTRAGFVAAVQSLSRLALQRRSRRMLWVDADFGAWPLDEPALLQTLDTWLRLPQRQLCLLATDFGPVQRERPRFVAWRRNWVHAVPASSPAAEDDAELPCLLLADGAGVVHLHDRAHWRGVAVSDPGLQRQWRERIDAVLQRSTAAWALTTLGL